MLVILMVTPIVAKVGHSHNYKVRSNANYTLHFLKKLDASWQCKTELQITVLLNILY